MRMRDRGPDAREAQIAAAADSQDSALLLSARLAPARVLAEGEAIRAVELLTGLGVALVDDSRLPRSAKSASRENIPGKATICVVGSWKMAEAQRLASGPGNVLVRGVSLLEYCSLNPDRVDLLTRQETPCILNTALRGEVVCFSGIVGEDKATMMFKVQVHLVSTFSARSISLVLRCKD